MFINDLKTDKSKAEIKRHMNKDLFEENRKLEEIKKNNESHEKEKIKDEELKLLAEQEKLKTQIDTDKLSSQKLGKALQMSKTTKGYNLNNTYEDNLRKLQMQSLNRCQEIDEKIHALEKRIDKQRPKNRLEKLQNEKKEFKIFRPLYNLLGTDNHVSKWKGPEESSGSKANDNSKLKTGAVENIKSNVKSKTAAFFATQIDKK